MVLLVEVCVGLLLYAAVLGTPHCLSMVFDSDFAAYPLRERPLRRELPLRLDGPLVIDCFVKVSHLFLPVRWMVSVLTG